MNFGICPLSVIPIRSSASDKSEMISQLLFGETAEILTVRKNWTRIRCTWDNYIGWIDTKQLKLIPPEDMHRYKTNFAHSLELVQSAIADDYYLPITIGATLPNFDGLKFHLNGSSYSYSGQAIFPDKIEPTIALVLKIARRYLYAPYLWGGRSPMGIDCSGFTQMVFKMVGIRLPRDASQQIESGDLIDFIEQSQAGDLAFFEDKKGKVHHVGLLIGDNKIIHSSGQVRIDKIDHFGIYNEKKKKYSHKLRLIKRLLPETFDQGNAESSEEISENQVELF